MGITLEWEGKVIDFGDMTADQVQDWISAQQAGEAMPEAGTAMTPPTKGERGAVAGAARYGIPVAAAALTKNIPITMAAAGVGEYAARTIEGEDTEDPREYAKQRFNDILHGVGAAGLEGLGLKYISPALTKGINWAHLQGSKLYRSLLLPEKMSPEMETTLRVLRVLSGGTDDLLTPSLGAMSRHERRIISYVEDIARSSLFTGKRWRAFDSKNLGVVEEEAKNLFRWMSEEVDDETFGRFVQMLIQGPQGENAYLRSVAKTMYNEAGKRARQLGVTVDMTELFNFTKRHGALDEVKTVLSRIDDELLDRGIDPKKAAGWDKIPADLAIEIRRTVNELVNKLGGSSKEGSFIIDKILNPRIRKPLENAFGADDELFYMLKKADDLIGTRNARLVEGKVTKAILNELSETPSGIMAYFKGAGVKKIDRLNNLEKMFTQTYVEGTGKVTRLGRQLLEDKVYPALRHSILSEAVDEQGNIIGSKLVKLLGRKGYGKDGGAFLDKIFSINGKSYVNALREFAVTLDQVSKQSVTGESAIWMKLAQGGAMIQAAGLAAGAAAYGAGEALDSNTFKYAGGTIATIFITPSLISRKLTNPQFIRMLTDGLAHGPKSRPFARMIATLTALNAKSITEWAKMNPNEKEFYASSIGKGLTNPVDFQPF